MTLSYDNNLKMYDFMLNNSSLSYTELLSMNFKDFMKFYYLTIDRIEKQNIDNKDNNK